MYPVHPVIACITCMRPHTHTHTHTHTANNRTNRSAPHAARMQPPSTPPPAPARAASTMAEAPHHAARNDSAPPALHPRSSSAHPDAHRPKPCNAGPRHGRAPTPLARPPRCLWVFNKIDIVLKKIPSRPGGGHGKPLNFHKIRANLKSEVSVCLRRLGVPPRPPKRVSSWSVAESRLYTALARPWCQGTILESN